MRREAYGPRGVLSTGPKAKTDSPQKPRSSVSSLPAGATCGTGMNRATVVRVIAGEPCGRREQWILFVRRCPHCQHTHSHRAGVAETVYSLGIIDRRCPETSRPHRLVGGAS